MGLIHTLLFNAGRRLAADPRVRAKAREAYETEIRPRAEKAAKAARPHIEAARDDLRRTAAETDPKAEPARFAGRAARRLWDGVTGKRKG